MAPSGRAGRVGGSAGGSVWWTGPVTSGEPGEGVSDDEIMGVLHEAVAAARVAFAELSSWGLAGTRSGQYHSDLAADAAVIDVLHRAGFGVLSEESGRPSSLGRSS